MAHRDSFDHDIIARQERMLRLAERDYGLTPAVIKAELGIEPGTLRTWKRDTMMPLAAFVRLCRIIPDELTSLVVEPAGKHIGSDEPADGCLETLDCEASGIVHEIAKAKRDKVVTPQERATIADMTRRMMPTARMVARA